MLFTAPPSTIAPTSSELSVLNKFLEEMSALDCQPALSDERKTKIGAARSKRTSKRPKKPHERSNPSWKRRKEELQKLKAETQTLETKVAFLRLRGTHCKLFAEYMDATKGTEKWKSAAKRELEKYEQAQADNAQLKLTIKRYKKASDALQAAFKSTDIRNLEMRTTAMSLQNDIRARGQLLLADTALFNTLACRVRARLQEVNAVLLQDRASMTEDDTDHLRVHRHDDLKATSVVEFTRSRLMPFSADQTSTIAWDLMKLRGFPNEHVGCGFSEDDDVVSEGWSTHLLNCKGTAKLRSHCLKKRVSIPGGFAVLVESISEWLAYPTSAVPWRYVTRDLGWTLVHHLEPTNLSSNVCRVRTKRRLTSADSNEAGICLQQIAQTQLTNAVSEVVIPSFLEMMQSRHQFVENAVIDSSLTPVTCNSFE